MPSNADGSIVIDTELDNEGFESGSDRLLRAIEELTDAVDILGDNMMRSFGEVIPLLQNIANTTSQVYGSMQSGATQTQQSVDQIAQAERNVNNAVDQTSQAIQQQGQAVSGFSAQTDQTSSSVSSLEREVNRLSTNMRSISRSAELGFNNGNAVLAFESRLTDIRNQLDDARSRLEAFGNTRIPTEDYAWLQDAIARAETQLERFQDRQQMMETLGTSHHSQAWRRLQEQIQQTTLMLETYRSEMADLESSGQAFTLGSDTQQYAQMRQSLQETEAALNRNRSLIDSEAIAQARLNILAAQERLARAQTAQEQAEALAQLQAAQDQLRAAADASANGGNSAPDNETVSRWEQFGNVLRTVASRGMRVGATLGRMPFRVIAAGAKKAVSALKSFASQAKRTTLSSNSLVKSLTSLKTLLVTQLKYMFISEITDGVKEGIKSLAKYSSSFDRAMSNIKNSISQLGGNLAVSLGNLVQAVEPALTHIINLINTAITYLNAFFAMLSGKKTMTVAKKSTESYADSISGAADAQKELNRQVYGFDELNKRSKESKSGGSGSGTGVEYEEVPIDDVLPDGIKKWMERLKDAWKNEDWYEVGRIIAEGLNAAMQTVDDWINNKFRPMGVKWAGIIATILNGLVDGFNWELLGKTIADGMNAIADILNTFFTTFHFRELGKGIGRAINSWFDNIEWDLMGQTLTNGIHSLFELVNGTISEIDWASIGNHIVEYICNIDLALLGRDVGELASNITNAFYQIVSNESLWSSLGTKISDGINGFLESMAAINPKTGLTGWQALGKDISETISGIANAITTALNGVDWAGVGNAIGEFISSIDFGSVTFDLLSLVGALASAIAETILNSMKTAPIETAIILLLGTMKFTGLGKKIFSALATKITSSIAGAIADAGGISAITSSVVGALSSAFAAVPTLMVSDISLMGAATGAEIAATLGTSLVAAIAAWFVGFNLGKELGKWITGDSETYDNFKWFGDGGFFDEMWDGSSTFLENVQTWVDALGLMFSDGWESIKSAVSPAWESIKSGLSTAWEGIKTTASTTWENISTTVSGAWENIKVNASTAWESVKTTVTTAFDNAKTSLFTTAENIKTDMSTAWEDVKSKTSTAWDNVKTSVTTRFNDAKTSLATNAESIKRKLSTTWENVKTTASTKWQDIKGRILEKFNQLKTNISTTGERIKTTVSEKWQSIKTTATTKWQDIKKTVTEKWEGLKEKLKEHDWTSIGTNLVNGLKNGIKNAWDGLTTSVGELCANLLNKVKSAFGINSPSRKMAEIGAYLDAGMQKGIKDNEGKVLATAKNLASAVTQKMTPDSPEIDISSTQTVNGLNLIADRLEVIAGQFNAIAGMIANMGGLVMPQIAQGTVVPYKTKIDTSEQTPVEFEAFKTFSSDMDERMADEIYVLRQILDAIKRLDLNIDIRALERAITKQKRNNDLNYGGA